MLKTQEFFDIQKIEDLRKLHGKELDSHDNFSWHIALVDGAKLLGVARLYKYNGGVMLDEPLLYKHNAAHNEMLFKTLMLKASNMNIKNIYAKEGNRFIKDFIIYKEGIIKTDIEHINAILNGGCCL